MEYIGGFPSQLVPPEVKESPDYCLLYGEAFHKEHKDGKTSSWFGFDNKSDQAEYRRFADGTNDPNFFKPFLSKLRTLSKGKQNLSTLTIDWSILPIAPKFVNNIIGKILELELETNVRAIDPLSVQEQEQKKYELLSFLKNAKFLENVSKTTQIEFDDMSPVPDGVPLPDDETDIDAYTELFLKNKIALEFQDFIEVGFEYNNIKEVMKEYVTNLVKVGAAGIEAYMSPEGTPKLRCMVPEATVTNNYKHDDGRDIHRVGEYLWVTISELKALWPGQPEKVYREIAKNQNSNLGNYHDEDFESYYSEHQCYPYDEDKIKIFRFRWKSSDKTKHVIKKRGDMPRVYQKNSDWLKDVDLKAYKEKNPNNTPIFQELDNWYGATYIPGTKYVFGCGRQTNMLRDSTNLAVVTNNVILRRTTPIMRVIMPILKAIQINWLKFLFHSQNSRMPMISIEMSAFNELALGQGGRKVEPKEALALAFETGVLVWKRKDWRSPASNQWKPIEELPGTGENKGPEHLKMCFDLIMLLRDVSGIPQIADSTVPTQDVGKYVAQQTLVNMKDTLMELFNTYLFTYNQVAKKMLELTQDSITFYGGEMYKRALGIDSVMFMKMAKDINHREWSIVIEMGMDDEKKQVILQMIQRAQETEQIDPETAYMLIQMKNPYQKILLLKQKIKERKKEIQQMEEFKVNAELQKNVESAKVSSDEEIRKLTVENELAKDLEHFKAQLQEGLEDKKTLNAYLIKQMEKGADLEGKEKEIMGKIIEKYITAQASIQKKPSESQKALSS